MYKHHVLLLYKLVATFQQLLTTKIYPAWMRHVHFVSDYQAKEKKQKGQAVDFDKTYQYTIRRWGVTSPAHLVM